MNGGATAGRTSSPTHDDPPKNRDFNYALDWSSDTITVNSEGKFGGQATIEIVSEDAKHAGVVVIGQMKPWPRLFENGSGPEGSSGGPAHDLPVR